MLRSALLIWQRSSQIAWQAQLVVALRLAGMAGALTQDPTEASIMVCEKPEAAFDALFGIWLAVVRGQSADKVAFAGLRPYHRRVHANVTRLSRLARERI